MRFSILHSPRGASGSRRDTTGRRPKMVAARVFEILSVLVTSRLQDPRVLDISVTHVDVTPDLSIARVYVSSAVHDANLADAVAALQHASGFLRRELAAELNLRKVPELRFYPDDVLRNAWKIEAVLSQLPEHQTMEQTSSQDTQKEPKA